MKRSVVEENLNLKINETVLRSAVNYAKLHYQEMTDETKWMVKEEQVSYTLLKQYLRKNWMRSALR